MPGDDVVGLAARSRKVSLSLPFPLILPVQGVCLKITSAGCWNPGAAVGGLGVVPLPLQADDEGGEDRGSASVAPGLWLLVIGGLSF